MALFGEDQSRGPEGLQCPSIFYCWGENDGGSNARLNFFREKFWMMRVGNTLGEKSWIQSGVDFFSR
jgi:hypothetical protein